MKLFSDQVYQQLTLNADPKRPLFAKPGEPADKAVKRLMAGVRRAQTSPGKRYFPTFVPGMTTAAYVKTFQALNGKNEATPGAYIKGADRAAPYFVGPEVEVLPPAEAVEECEAVADLL